MKKIIIIAIVFVLTTVASSAQMRSNNTWSIGVGARLGMGSMMQKAEEVKSDRTAGFDGSAEGVLTYYFSRKEELPQFGFRTGLSLGYRQNSLKTDKIDVSYTEKDALGNSIIYHATAEDVKEVDRQFAVEIPAMFAAYYNRIFANIGLCMGVPLMSRYKQTMSNPTLSATYEEYGVTISGERVTGIVSSGEDNKKAKLDASSFNMCLSLEAGYTFDFLGNSLLVGMYADYGLVDNFKGKANNFTEADPSTIDGATNTPTKVVVHSLTDSYVSNVGIFCMGLRAVYTMEFHTSRGKKWRR